MWSWGKSNSVWKEFAVGVCLSGGTIKIKIHKYGNSVSVTHR